MAELDEIRARAEAATPGPWFASDRGVGWHITLTAERDKYGCPPGRDGDGLLPSGERTDIGREADAEFIAHARTDIPELLAEVESLHQQIRTFRSGHTEAVTLLEEEVARLGRLEKAAKAFASIEKQRNDPAMNSWDWSDGFDSTRKALISAVDALGAGGGE